MILDPYRQTIDDYLATDDYQATWLFDRVKKMGYPGSYETLRDYVRSVKERRIRLAYARFETEPGLQAQVDWGDFQVEMDVPGPILAITLNVRDNCSYRVP